MKILATVLVGAAICAAPLLIAAPASAQAVVDCCATTTTTAQTYHSSRYRTYHHGYAYRTRTTAYGYEYQAVPYNPHAAYNTGAYIPDDASYVPTPAYRDASAHGVDAGFEGPLGVPVYANGDVTVICGCEKH